MLFIINNFHNFNKKIKINFFFEFVMENQKKMLGIITLIKSFHLLTVKLVTFLFILVLSIPTPKKSLL